MSTFVLIHGAGSEAWYWHLVVPDLRSRGHDAVAPELPSDDDSAGFPEYADAVVETVGDRTDLVLVAQSLGGFTAPLVCARRTWAVASKRRSSNGLPADFAPATATTRKATSFRSGRARRSASLRTVSAGLKERRFRRF